MALLVSVEPVQTVFFRDSRPFDAGIDAVADSVPPSPVALFGVITGHYLEHKGVTIHEFREKGDAKLGQYNPAISNTGIRMKGPIIEHGGVKYCAPPANLWASSANTQAYVLKPVESRDWLWDIQDESLMPVSLPAARQVARPEPLDRMISEEGMQNYLQGTIETGLLSRYIKSETGIFVRERRFGHARSRLARTVEEGLLYSATHLRPQEYIADRSLTTMRFVVQVEGFAQDDLPDGLTPVGGEGRFARLASQELPQGTKLIQNNDRVKEGIKTSKRFLLYFLTPSVFNKDNNGWRKDWSCVPELRGATMVGACVTKPYMISGWVKDKIGAGGVPRALYKVVPAGSVYFFNAPGWKADNFEILYTTYNCGKSLSDIYPDAGFGIALVGMW